MSECDDESPVRSRVPLRLGLFVIGLLLYVLSIGPVAWVVKHHGWTTRGWVENAIVVFYMPLELAMDRVPWLDQFVGWYVDFIRR